MSQSDVRAGSFRVLADAEPMGSDAPKYPRSLQIGVNDQQIEGCTSTAKASASAPVAADEGSAACADGSCSVK